jgi:hypothetical protein
MTTPRDPEALLSAYLEEGMEVLPDRVVDAVLDEVHGTRRRATFGPRRTRSMMKTALAAAAAIAVVVSGAALLLNRPGQPSIGGPSMPPSASRPAAVGPSALPTATPSPTPTPLVWTQESLHEDWPAPVRVEPVGDAIVLPILMRVVNGHVEHGHHPDGSGDTGSKVSPWVDIHEVGFCQGQTRCIRITLVSNDPPFVDPAEQWIAYGLVVDDDGDGVGDRRFGIDNIPAADPDAHHRAWITDLHTGRTESAVGPPYGAVGETIFDTFYPPGAYGVDGARLSFGGDAAGGGKVGGLPERFYAWASVIEDGRVVATDYAPDVGWLDPVSTP